MEPVDDELIALVCEPCSSRYDAGVALMLNSFYCVRYLRVEISESLPQPTLLDQELLIRWLLFEVLPPPEKIRPTIQILQICNLAERTPSRCSTIY